VAGYVREFASSAPGAVSVAKALIRRLSGIAPSEAVAITTETIAARRVSQEGQEGMRAFLARRPARWVSTEKAD
jgi:methylglutaconyl-CoA hydratase